MSGNGGASDSFPLLVVTDSTALIGLERIGRLDLLPSIFAEVMAPAVVAEEFGRRPSWLKVRSVELPASLAALWDRLDLGEAEAIALALEHPGCALLMDELPGRRVAERLGLDLVGTLGLLLLAKKRGLLSAIQPEVDALLETGFHLSKMLYDEVLQLAGEA